MSRQTIHYSVIVPAFRENGNIRPLVTRIFAALRTPDSPVPAEQVEIIIVDDNSRDGSVETVQDLQREGYNVRIVVRTTERGLSSAVVRGFQEAVGDNMLCMDADLQVGSFILELFHELIYFSIAPARVCAYYACSMSPTHTFVLGTRYGKGVEMDKDWPLYRRIISSGARLLALPLTTASDPMSGFFGIRKESVSSTSCFVSL